LTDMMILLSDAKAILRLLYRMQVLVLS